MVSSTANVQEELRAYLEEKEIKNLFVTLVEAMLIEKPSTPVKFIVEYLKVSYTVRSIVILQGSQSFPQPICSLLEFKEKFPLELEDTFTSKNNRKLAEQV